MSEPYHTTEPLVGGEGTAADRATWHAGRDDDVTSQEPVEVEEVGILHRQIAVHRARGRSVWFQALGPDGGEDLFRDGPRQYRSSPLPAIHGQPIPAGSSDGERETLAMLYTTATGAWHLLTDVRFKLLGLLPAVSVVAWAQIWRADATTSSAVAGLAVALAGLLVSFGLWIYDRRNSELYDDLISRARRIEQELGVHTGVFRGRLKPSQRLINHGTAVGLVYATVMAGWALLAGWFVSLIATV